MSATVYLKYLIKLPTFKSQVLSFNTIILNYNILIMLI